MLDDAFTVLSQHDAPAACGSFSSEEVCKVTGKDVYELGDLSRFLDGQAKSQAAGSE